MNIWFDTMGSDLLGMQDIEEIELTEVFGGGLNMENSDTTVVIRDLDHAIDLFTQGNIAGFEIGSCINNFWAPICRVRQWGGDAGGCQIKSVDHQGQEGSGYYSLIGTPISRKLMREFVERSTIREGHILHGVRSRMGKAPLTAEECSPQFRAL